MSRRVRYYRSFSDDFVESADQRYALPEEYCWVREDGWSRVLSAVIYGTAFVLSSVYCRVFLHVRFKNRRVLRQTKQTGAVIYANHTQPVGDVFIPALACSPNRIYTVVSPANFGIPVIGRLLPYLGALPVPDNVRGLKRFSAAVAQRLQQHKCVVIYPEAHVWEYYTGIRPFPETPFKFPVKHGVPVYSMTTTYQRRHFGGRPRATVYIDGPFYPDTAVQLRDAVHDRMRQRSRYSTYEYIRYEERKSL